MLNGYYITYKNNIYCYFFKNKFDNFNELKEIQEHKETIK